MIHGHNNTHTTREGYILQDYMNDIPELIYSGDPTEIYNINPGLYKIDINGTLYAFVIHDTISGSNRLIIRTEEYAYTLMGLTVHRVYLYKIHDHQIIENKGHLLRHTVNDALDLLIVDGYTRTKPDHLVSMKYPRELEFMSMLNIKMSSEDIEEEYLFNMKNYLKSIEITKKKRICDTMYLDRASNRALFVFNTARLIMTGYETIDKIDSLCGDHVNVYKLLNPLCKPNGLIQCSHLPTISWKQMSDKTYSDEGICLSPEGDSRGIYFKIPLKEFENAEDVLKEILRFYTVSKEEERNLRWTEARAHREALGLDPDSVLLHSITVCPFTMCYELANPQYKQLTLDSYEINTFFNKSWMIVYPYKPVGKHIVEYLNNIIGLERKDGVIESILEQMEKSGDPEKYAQIISENEIWRDIISNEENPLIDYGINIDSYNENNARLREIVLKRLSKEDMALINYDNPDLVAVIPKDGIIKSMAEQLQESGLQSEYARILTENIIWRNLLLTGELNTRVMYFYKHLDLSE